MTRVVTVRARRAILRMHNRSSALCFNAWVDTVVEARRIRGFLAKWLNFGSSAVFARWVDFVYEVQHVDMIVANVARRLRDLCKRNCFFAWRDTLRSNRITKAKIAQVAAKLGYRGCRTVFVAWSNWFRTKRDLLRQMDWVVLRIQKVLLFHVWEKWLEFVHQIVVVRRILVTVSQRGISRAWRRWVDSADERFEQRGVLERALARISNVGRAAAFCRWVGAVDTKKHTVVTIGRVKAKMLNKSLGRAFGTWSDCHAQIVEARDAREQKGRVAIMRLLCASMARAFTRWALLLHQRLLLRKFAVRLRRCGLSQGFFGWVESVSVAQAHRDALLTALVKMRNCAASRAFIRWYDWLGSMKYDRQVLATVIRRFANLALAAAYFGWLDHVATIKRQRAILAAVLVRMERRHYAGAFRSWVEFVGYRRFLAAVLLKMSRASLTRAFLEFREKIYRKIQIEESLISLIAVWQSRSTGKCFNRWADDIAERYI